MKHFVLRFSLVLCAAVLILAEPSHETELSKKGKRHLFIHRSVQLFFSSDIALGYLKEKSSTCKDNLRMNTWPLK